MSPSIITRPAKDFNVPNRDISDELSQLFPSEDESYIGVSKIDQIQSDSAFLKIRYHTLCSTEKVTDIDRVVDEERESTSDEMSIQKHLQPPTHLKLFSSYMENLQ